MLIKYRVSMEFGSYADTELDAAAGKVVSGLTKNPAFPNPPVSAADLGKLASGYHTAIQASMHGGLQLTAAKNNAREALLNALHQEAHYVQSVAGHDLETLLSSGFFASNGSRHTSSPLITPIVALVSDLGTTQLRVRLACVPNAKSYQVQISGNGNAGWQDAGIYTKTRGIVIEQLVPGTVYNVRVRAIGGSTGASGWSDPVSKMAT
jgi:hypothetical protein